ncbi:MAG: type II toxin-antitoxin system prevent-host-death family antitoxin [Myxococcales bacterium]|nr:type II toxin-antitoxin system prevent-host-death family antitoxin [Myxococcales bacterium]
MKTAKLSEAKDRLSYYVERVRRGESVRITVRGRPVADLVPIADAPATDADEEAWLADLEHRGIIRRGKGGVDPEILKPGPRVKGRPLSQTLIDERRSGR